MTRSAEITVCTSVAPASPRADQDPGAARLAALYVDELKRLAEAHLRRERANHTLQRTELADEAYLRLLGGHATTWESRAHFLALASETIRHILVDHARRRSRRKRGGGWSRVGLEVMAVEDDVRAEELLDLDEALAELRALSPRLGLVVELRYFGGLSDVRIGEMLGVSDRTVRKEWALARGWLHRRLRGRIGDQGEAG
jgi:RNA polymerase sigma factor (TIGR02999 family)